MKVKIDTKEKFHVITPQTAQISATMAEDIREMLLPYLQQEVKNLVLNLSEVDSLDLASAEQILHLQKEFYENSASFVTCCMKKDVEIFLNNNDLWELFNSTPTESEAWDIVQMEEIEREIMDDGDWEEPS